jgi:hypothetical protein
VKSILLPSPIGGHNNIATDHVPDQRPFSSDAVPEIVLAGLRKMLLRPDAYRIMLLHRC